MRAHVAALLALLLAYVELVVATVVEVAVYAAATSWGATPWNAVLTAVALGMASIYLADTARWFRGGPRGRPLTHVGREWADRVADWGGLPYEDDPDDTPLSPPF
ncbi:hypothetical protein [Streptomyces sp. NPDC007063]